MLTPSGLTVSAISQPGEKDTVCAASRPADSTTKADTLVNEKQHCVRVQEVVRFGLSRTPACDVQSRSENV